MVPDCVLILFLVLALASAFIYAFPMGIVGAMICRSFPTPRAVFLDSHDMCFLRPHRLDALTMNLDTGGLRLTGLASGEHLLSICVPRSLQSREPTNTPRCRDCTHACSTMRERTVGESNVLPVTRCIAHIPFFSAQRASRSKKVVKRCSRVRNRCRADRFLRHRRG